MSEADNFSAMSAGEMSVDDEEDVDEIRLGPLVDELSTILRGEYTREEMVQAIINCRFDVKSAMQFLSTRETSFPRQSPDKGKRNPAFEDDNLLVQYQLPRAYCHNSAIFIENRTLDRLPLHRIVREWLCDILRKRSKQKREEEKARYFRNRNESQCSEDSVVTTSGESQDVLGDNSQDLSEDSQEMVVDWYDKGEETSSESSKEQQHSIHVPPNAATLAEGDFKFNLSTDVSVQSLPVAIPSIPPLQLPVPKLQIPPLVNTCNSFGESVVFQIPNLNLPHTVDENSNKTVPHLPPMGNKGNEIGILPSSDSSGMFELAKSIGNESGLGISNNGPSLSELANSSLNGGKSQLVMGVKEPSLSELANLSLSDSKPQVNKRIKGPSLSDLANSSQTESKPHFGVVSKGPSLSDLADSSLTESKPQFGIGFKGPNLSDLANPNLTGVNPQCGVGIKGSSLSEMASSGLTGRRVHCDDFKGTNLSDLATSNGSSGLQFYIPKLNTGTILNQQPSISTKSGIQNFSSLGDSSGNNPNFSGKNIDSPLMAPTTVGDTKSLSSLPGFANFRVPPLADSGSEGSSSNSLSLHSSSPAGSSPSLSTLASTFLGSNNSSITSVPPLEMGKRGKLYQGNESNLVGVNNSDSVISVTGGFNNFDKHNIPVPGRPPGFSSNMNLNKLSSHSPVCAVVDVNEFEIPCGDQPFLKTSEKSEMTGTDRFGSELGFQVPQLPQPKPDLKPPPGFHDFLQSSVPEKECLETLLKQEEEVDMNEDIDLLSALLKPQMEEDSDVKITQQSSDLVIDLQVCPFMYDATLWKQKPSSFGKVMLGAPCLPKVKRLSEKVIQVPFKIFRFDTPSPDELIQEALQNKRDPGWYKLVTKERHSRR